MNLPSLPQDKANHALYGAAIALCVSVLTAPWLGLLAAVLAGAAKEGVDYLTNRRSVTPLADVSWLDFAATSAGGLAIFAATMVR